MTQFFIFCVLYFLGGINLKQGGHCVPEAIDQSPVLIQESLFWEQKRHLIREYHIPAGGIICSPESPVEGLYYVKDGRVKVSMFMANGIEQTLGIIDVGGTFCEFAAVDGSPCSVLAVATLDSEIWVVPRAVMQEALCNDPALAWLVMQSMARKQRVNLRHLEALVSMNAFQRVALTLTQLAAVYGRPVGDNPSWAVRITRDELAKLTGTSSVTVSRVITRLVNLGLLIKHKWEFVIPDLDRLREIISTPDFAQREA